MKHDTRLDNLTNGQYRIWHDGQNVLVPVGESTTKPLTNEIIGVNTKVYGRIADTTFKAPIVEFTNTTNGDFFDRFSLSIYRDEIPPNINDFRKLILSFDITVNFNGLRWVIPVRSTLTRFNNNFFTGGRETYTTAGYPFAVPSTEYTVNFNSYFTIGRVDINSLPLANVDENNLIYINVDSLNVFNSSSTYLMDNVYNPNVPNVSFNIGDSLTIVGGYS